MIGDGMFSIAKLVATESILSPIMWQWKFFGRHTISDGKFQSPQAWQLNYFCHHRLYSD
jgi:hypothetical protein